MNSSLLTFETRRIISVLVLICLVIASSGCTILSPTQYPYIDDILAEDVTLGDTWKEINVQGKIVFHGDDRFLSLFIKPPFQGDPANRGIRRPEGELFNPEIVLVDKSGRRFELSQKGFLGEMRPFFYFVEKVDPNTEFVTLLIRSDQEISVRKVTWTYVYAWEPR
ncbi:MAG: hypothetical protein KIT61_07825 [Pyrinomonadaceae bacterium]|nr:hypothetical protein [Pyrinomonadaceae bacterium]